MTTVTPTTLSVPDFSAHIGCKRSYGYELKKAGRLVMTPDGKKVMVAESIARIAATRDPAHTGVAEHHAAQRGAPAVTGHQPSDDNDGGQGEGEQAEVGGTPPQYDFQGSKAKREHWAAEREHAQYLKEAGELMERGAVVAAFADAGANLRAGLEAWQSTLPPQLVGLDEAAIRTTLADQVERLLHDLVDKFNRMAAQESARE